MAYAYSVHERRLPMATTRTFEVVGLANKTDNEAADIKAFNMQPVSTFGLDIDNGDICALTNSQSPIDAVARASFMAENISKVATTLTLPNGKVVPGMHVTIKYEDSLRETVTEDSTVIKKVDYPLNYSVQFRVPLIDGMDSTVNNKMLKALLGLFFKADGSTRFNQLVRSSLRPTQD
jgi:hypothetical protein